MPSVAEIFFGRNIFQLLFHLYSWLSADLFAEDCCFFSFRYGIGRRLSGNTSIWIAGGARGALGGFYRDRFHVSSWHLVRIQVDCQGSAWERLDKADILAEGYWKLRTRSVEFRSFPTTQWQYIKNIGAWSKKNVNWYTDSSMSIYNQTTGKTREVFISCTFKMFWNKYLHHEDRNELEPPWKKN